MTTTTTTMMITVTTTTISTTITIILIMMTLFITLSDDPNDTKSVRIRIIKLEILAAVSRSFHASSASPILQFLLN